MIPFVLGQIGLGLTAFCGIAIAHIMNQLKIRPPWYHVLGIWALSVAAVFAFSDPLVYPRYNYEYLPFVAYLFRLIVGLSCLAGFVRYRFNRGKPFSKNVVNRANQIMFVGSSMAFALVFCIWLFGDKATTQDQINNLQRMAQVNRKIFTRDTVLTARLQSTIDQQNQAIKTYQFQIATLTSQLEQANKNIERLGNVIVSLNRQIKLIGRQQSVLHEDMGDIKRSQTPPPLEPKPPKEFVLPTDRVVPIGPRKHHNP